VNEAGVQSAVELADAAAGGARRPRIGFLGTGWIGRHRMSALAASGSAHVLAAADPDPAARRAVVEQIPGVALAEDLDGLLEHGLDGVVIATPSALHAEQAIAALQRGVAVYCQKPLARDRAETRRVLDAARTADRLLDVDLCYRHTDAARAVRAELATDALGEVFAAELVFHNAYGPDKPWFTERRLSGGGCLIDLGTHLVDLLVWLLGAQRADVRAARVLREGRPLAAGADAVEDYALAELAVDGAVTARLACSWWLHAGRDCVLECTLYGTQAALSIRNVGGSFYDFVAERWDGTARRRLSEPGEDWGSRGISQWAVRLAAGAGYDGASARELEQVAATVDGIYEAAR
jgi:predicted dehydrogenase